MVKMMTFAYRRGAAGMYLGHKPFIGFADVRRIVPVCSWS
jgi:hypothetical protein